MLKDTRNRLRLVGAGVSPIAQRRYRIAELTRPLHHRLKGHYVNFHTPEMLNENPEDAIVRPSLTLYGSLGPDDPPFTENTPYAPDSPYAASKAASDHLGGAYHHTYGLPTLLAIAPTITVHSSFRKN
jgi:hypothetical protein